MKSIKCWGGGGNVAIMTSPLKNLTKRSNEAVSLSSNLTEKGGESAAEDDSNNNPAADLQMDFDRFPF